MILIHILYYIYNYGNVYPRYFLGINFQNEDENGGYILEYAKKVIFEKNNMEGVKIQQDLAPNNYFQKMSTLR